MAPLPPNNTGRFFLDYSDAIHTHTLMVRYLDAEASISDVMSGVDALFVELSPVMYDVSILEARFSDAGSNITVPVAWTGATTYGDDGAAPLLNGPVQLRFEGRSVGGRRGSISIWAYSGGVPGTFRTPIVAATPLAEALGVIQAGQAAFYFVAIDNGAMNMKTYVNIQFNSYWEAKQRT